MQKVANNIINNPINNPIIGEQKEEEEEYNILEVDLEENSVKEEEENILEEDLEENSVKEEEENILEEEENILEEEEKKENILEEDQAKSNITFDLDINKVIFFIILGIVLYLLLFKYDIINKQIEYIKTSHLLYSFGGFLAMFKIIGNLKTNKNNISLYLYLISIGLLNLKNLLVLFEKK
jgi:hypothetical protein